MKTLLGAQTNFTAGELSPRLWGHVDVAKYKNGLKEALNCTCLPHGPVQRRNSTKYIAGVKTHSKTVKLLRFQFNQENAYILEFGHQYIRFYNTDGQILSGGSPYEVATTYTEAELTELTYVQFGTTIYLAHSAHPPAKLVWTNSTSWALSDIFFYPPVTSEDGLKPSTTLTPAATTGIGINFTAGSGVFIDGDVGRQLHNLGGAGKASIVSLAGNTVAVCDIVEDFPSTSAITSQNWKIDLSPIAKLSTDQTSIGVTATVNSMYTDSTRGPPKAITGATVASPGVITAVAHGFAVGDKIEIKNILGTTFLNNKIWVVGTVPSVDTLTLKDANANAVDTTTFGSYVSGGTIKRVYTDVGLDSFRSGDVDRYLIFNGGIGQITSVTSAKTVKMELQKSMTAAADTSIWPIEQEAWTSTKGYPRTVALHQQRLWFGGTTSAPQTIVGSESGIFDSMAIGSDPSDAVQFDISTSEVNEIQWLYGLRSQLVVGTSGAELTVDSGQVAGPITPDSIVQESRSYNGSNLQQPVALESELLYIQRSGMKINSFQYNFQADNYISDNLIFLAEHLPRNGGGIKEIAYAQDPDRLIYAVLNDGTMAVGTYYRDQQVIAWTVYSTDGVYENVQTISTGINDEVWVCVKRTINGSVKRYVERFDVSTGEDNLDGFSDSYLTYSLPKTITGITKADPAVVTSASQIGRAHV